MREEDREEKRDKATSVGLHFSAAGNRLLSSAWKLSLMFGATSRQSGISMLIFIQ